MMLRDLFVAGVLAILIPLSFLRPWIGVLTWTWVSYMSPHRLAYGFVQHAPVALIVAGATLAGMLLRRERGHLPRAAEVVLLIGLWLVFLLSSTVGAIYPDRAWDQFENVSKILLMTLVTMALMQTRERLTATLAVVAFSLGFFGLKGGIWAFATGGRFHVLGPDGTFIGGNTEIALALNMNLPIIFFLRRQVKRPWLRHLMLATFLFSIVAIISTYSRGGLLGLVAVLLYLTLRSRRRFLAISLILVGIVIAADLVPQKWTERMQTIETYHEDRSAMGRIHAWEFAIRLAADRPFLGGGFRCFTYDVQIQYMPEQYVGGFDAHNIFFQVLGEHGYLGLIMYVLVIAATLNTLRTVLRRTKQRANLEWLRDYAQMVQGSLGAYLVSGFFLSLSYFDLFYLLIAVTVILKQLLRMQLRQERSAPDPLTPGLAGAA